MANSVANSVGKPDGLGWRWWEAFRREEAWAFDFLYQSFRKPLLCFLADRVGDLETAKDLLQEVFIKVHRFRNLLELQAPQVAAPGRAGGEGKSSKNEAAQVKAVSGWVFEVARNTLYDWWRSIRVETEKVRFFEPMEEPEVSHLMVHDPKEPNSGEAVVAASEKRAIFRGWLSRLTAPQRRVVWLWLVRGLSLEEISSQLGISINAVKLLLHRAKASA
ncbi:MAG: RNA polymerase sigma factor [Oligoflexia bacterium]